MKYGYTTYLQNTLRTLPLLEDFDWMSLHRSSRQVVAVGAHVHYVYRLVQHGNTGVALIVGGHIDVCR